MPRIVRRYTEEFRREAVSLALKSPSIGHTAKELGISSGTLYSWVHELKKSGSLAKVNTSSAKDMAILIEENRRLHC